MCLELGDLVNALQRGACSLHVLTTHNYSIKPTGKKNILPTGIWHGEMRFLVAKNTSPPHNYRCVDR